MALKKIAVCGNLYEPKDAEECVILVSDNEETEYIAETPKNEEMKAPAAAPAAAAPAAAPKVAPKPVAAAPAPASAKPAQQAPNIQPKPEKKPDYVADPQSEAELKLFAEKCERIFEEVKKDIIGQTEVVQYTIIAIIAGGNVLLEGAPGLGKTRLVRSLGHVFDLPFSRIQFTPDLMPADVTGTNIITKDENGNSFGYDLHLTFDEQGNCTITDQSDDIEVSGSGKFVVDGEKNSLGGKERNALYLDYTVDFGSRNMKYATKDTLVLRTRNVYGAGTFDVEIK